MSAHLTFEVGGHRYAIPIGWVAEVTRSLPLHWIPRVPLSTGGAVNLRGEPLPAVDGGEILGCGASGTRNHLLVLQAPDGRRIALRVDRVTDIDRKLPQKLATVAEPPPSGPFVTWVEHDTALGLVDAEALVHAVSDLINPNSRSRDAYRNEGETSHV